MALRHSLDLDPDPSRSPNEVADSYVEKMHEIFGLKAQQVLLNQLSAKYWPGVFPKAFLNMLINALGLS